MLRNDGGQAIISLSGLMGLKESNEVKLLEIHEALNIFKEWSIGTLVIE